jgi:hypothetical protein
MYILQRNGFGEPSNGPGVTTLRMRPVPFVRLDRFDFDKASLTRRLAEMVRKFGDAVLKSFASAQPIESIRLVGHTDSTGSETYNVGLGDRRASTVAVALQEMLKGFGGRVTIVVAKSPGELEPVADNGTSDGQALNRRVEVFVTVRVAPPPPPPPKPRAPNLWKPPTLPPDSVIVTHPSKLDEGIRNRLPARRAGQSFKDFLDNVLKDFDIPKVLRGKIYDAIVGKDWGLLNSLLTAAGIGGATRDAIIESARAATEGKAQ